MSLTMQAFFVPSLFVAAMVFVVGIGISVAFAQDHPGEAQFVKSCGTCHAATPDAPKRQGPNLWQIVDRPSGQQPGFRYSEALEAAELVWDAETLDRWITNAKKVVPGTSMMYRQRNPEKRKLIIEYLTSLGANGGG